MGSGEWEKELCVMGQDDVRSYVDPERKKSGPGRRGTNEEEPGREGIAVEDSVGQAEEGDEDFSLQAESQTRRDGTGETRKQQSWIWLTRQINLRDGADENDNEILRAEWCRSRAWAHRAEEEERYLKVEMERSLCFLEWKGKWWDGHQVRPNPGRVPHLEEGVKAYAARQGEIQRGLRDRFLNQWNMSLKKEDLFRPDRVAREELGVEERDDDDKEDEEEEVEEGEYNGGDTVMAD